MRKKLDFALKHVKSVVVVMPFSKGRNESCQSLRQAGLLYGRWRHHLSPPPQFRLGIGGEDILLPPQDYHPQYLQIHCFNKHVRVSINSFRALKIKRIFFPSF
ncbi:hypothetical protein TNCV_1729161 [Trichonephila clavipes]|nr:hypothetical protein TNCV_1729161 [Trichonephila clavipes]